MKKIFLTLIVLLISTMASASNDVVYVYNWTEYLPHVVLEKFKAETGVKVKYSTYDSNESMYARIKLMKKGGYDVVFPSTYFVHRMRREGLLAPIDKNKLKNYSHLDQRLMDKPYDPQNKFSIPYVWGSTGVGYNKKYVKEGTIKSWKDLFKPEFKNRLVMTDDLREVLGVGLKLNGFSLNDTDPDHIRQSYETMKKILPNVRVFSSDSPKNAFLSLEVYAGMIWNGEIFMAAAENPDIGYIYPEDGAIFWVDSMVIPKNAPNIDNAHKFIDFLLRPDIAKLICEYLGYAPANKTVVSLLDKELRDNQIVFPLTSDVEKGEFQLDVGDAILVYEKYWEMLKTSD